MFFLRSNGNPVISNQLIAGEPEKKSTLIDCERLLIWSIYSITNHMSLK